MIYGWIIGGLAALDLGVKSVVEGQEDDTFPRDLPSAKGFIKLHKNHKQRFSLRFYEGKTGIGKGDSAYGDFGHGRSTGSHDAG